MRNRVSSRSDAITVEMQHAIWTEFTNIVFVGGNVELEEAPGLGILRLGAPASATPRLRTRRDRHGHF